ncbi:MAG: hypothetical protein EAZ89_07520 [Bacteroidetes bacterium]|nr:MAG: hypothetical protein EAZ89_07520 [Bacteroidota bacterium]
MWRNNRAPKLAGLFLLFLALFNYPLLGLIGQGSWGEIPAFYAGVFVLWLLLIILTMIIVERKRPGNDS